jgi:hypothetical protein
VCLELRGAKLRTINLDNVERPVFEPV